MWVGGVKTSVGLGAREEKETSVGLGVREEKENSVSWGAREEKENSVGWGEREEKENSVGWGVRDECLKQKGVIALAFTPFSVLVAGEGLEPTTPGL